MENRESKTRNDTKNKLAKKVKINSLVHFAYYIYYILSTFHTK